MLLPTFKKLMIGLILVLSGSEIIPTTWAALPPEIPVPGMVTLVDLGANTCIPCKMMAPILEKMERVYQGKAAVVFIDVWKNPAGAERFKIRVIPTQIFFDKKGKEVLRHEGFLSEKDIIAVFKKLGIN
jgi:thioredoxin 1